MRPALRGLWQTVELAIQAFPGGLIALAVSLLGVILSCYPYSTLAMGGIGSVPRHRTTTMPRPAPTVPPQRLRLMQKRIVKATDTINSCENVSRNQIAQRL